MASELDGDPIFHARKVRQRLEDTLTHMREDVEKVDDPRAKAMFETAAEVLLGLEKAFADYEEGVEPAWR